MKFNDLEFDMFILFQLRVQQNQILDKNSNIQSMNSELPDQNRLNINNIMYNIQTKLSLLSQIQQNNQQDKQNIQHQIKAINNQSQQEQFPQINLPMQLLNQKMLSIINQRSPQRHLPPAQERTFEKKRMQLNELQTATRNIDEIKLQRNKSGVGVKRVTSQEAQRVGQFKQVNSEVEMSESLMNSSKSSSKILSKFNSIQLNYTQKIKTLSYKVSFLQQRLQQAQQEKHEILSSLQTYKTLYTRKQDQIDREIQSKLQEIKEKLVEKFAEQCRLKYNDYINQLKESTSALNEERKRRKFFEEQNKVMKLQKENYEHMYKAILRKQKEWLKIDINQTRNQLNNQIDLDKMRNQPHVQIDLSSKTYIQDAIYLKATNDKAQQVECSQIENRICNYSEIFDKENVISNKRSNYLLEENQKTTIDKQNNSKQKSKSKSCSKNNSKDKNVDKPTSNNKKSKENHSKQSRTKVSTTSQDLKNSGVRKTKNNSNPDRRYSTVTGQMSKQELIPFLAKGIQQLKQKLKMK